MWKQAPSLDFKLSFQNRRAPHSNSFGCLDSMWHTALQQASQCSCIEKGYNMLVSLVIGRSEMEQRRIDFENKILPVLSEGAVCTLLYFHDSDHKDVLHQVSRVVTSLWNNSSKEEGLSHEAAGSSVMIVFEALEFKWATLEQVQNQPKFVGSASLSKIHVCEKNDVTVDGMKRCNLAFINRNKDKLLSLQFLEGRVRDTWYEGVHEALAVLAHDIEEVSSEENSLLYNQQRYLDLERRKKEREEKKKKMGNVGMKYTAQAMIDK